MLRVILNDRINLVLYEVWVKLGRGQLFLYRVNKGGDVLNVPLSVNSYFFWGFYVGTYLSPLLKGFVSN